MVTCADAMITLRIVASGNVRSELCLNIKRIPRDKDILAIVIISISHFTSVINSVSMSIKKYCGSVSSGFESRYSNAIDARYNSNIGEYPFGRNFATIVSYRESSNIIFRGVSKISILFCEYAVSFCTMFNGIFSILVRPLL